MPQPSARTLRPVPFPVQLLADPANARSLHTAVWLYLVLRAAAAPETGRLLVKPADLASVLDASPATVLSLLGRLRAHRFVETRRVQGQIEVRVVDWAPPPRAPTPASASSSRPHTPNPHDEPGLALEIAETFDDLSNLARYEDIVETYPEPLVRRAFREARLVPRDRVRKSRGAIFTYLLKTYENNTNLEEDLDS